MGDPVTTPAGIDNTTAAATTKPTLAPAPTPDKTVAPAVTPPVDSTEPAAEPDALDVAVDAWLKDQINNSPVSRDTEAYNHLRASLPALLQAIRGI